jgi:hypothetical protein
MPYEEDLEKRVEQLESLLADKHTIEEENKKLLHYKQVVQFIAEKYYWNMCDKDPDEQFEMHKRSHTWNSNDICTMTISYCYDPMNSEAERLASAIAHERVDMIRDGDIPIIEMM